MINALITLFLCGDVMLGRGIDQILPHPVDPEIYESYVKDARTYVRIAEQANGRIPGEAEFSYIWGDALAELNEMQPDVRIINLETSITHSPTYWKDKEIHYRMSPQNAPCLSAARIDFCSLANNHILDWGYQGLAETTKTLDRLHIKYAGAGENVEQAQKPVLFEIEPDVRVVVFSAGLTGSGIPSQWAAADDQPGVNLFSNDPDELIRTLKAHSVKFAKKNTIIVLSVHWGGNWGYEISGANRQLAHRLIDEAGVDVIHGHSSHHVKGIEVYKDRLILYGCGDFINDYEGIKGYESYRSDLTLMYFPDIDSSSGKLINLKMVPLKIERFKLNRASQGDAQWLRDVLNREGKKLGTGVELTEDNSLILQWD